MRIGGRCISICFIYHCVSLSFDISIIGVLKANRKQARVFSSGSASYGAKWQHQMNRAGKSSNGTLRVMQWIIIGKQWLYRLNECTKNCLFRVRWIPIFWDNSQPSASCWSWHFCVCVFRTRTHIPFIVFLLTCDDLFIICYNRQTFCSVSLSFCLSRSIVSFALRVCHIQTQLKSLWMFNRYICEFGIEQLLSVLLFRVESMNWSGIFMLPSTFSARRDSWMNRLFDSITTLDCLWRFFFFIYSGQF